MLEFLILNSLFPNIPSLAGVVYLTLVFALFFQVWHDCRLIGEKLSFHLIFIFALPILTGFCWLLIWPGTLRLRLSGKSLKTSKQAILYRRWQFRNLRSRK